MLSVVQQYSLCEVPNTENTLKEAFKRNYFYKYLQHCILCQGSQLGTMHNKANNIIPNQRQEGCVEKWG